MPGSDYRRDPRDAVFDLPGFATSLPPWTRFEKEPPIKARAVHLQRTYTNPEATERRRVWVNVALVFKALNHFSTIHPHGKYYRVVCEACKLASTNAFVIKDLAGHWSRRRSDFCRDHGAEPDTEDTMLTRLVDQWRHATDKNAPQKEHINIEAEIQNRMDEWATMMADFEYYILEERSRFHSRSPSPSPLLSWPPSATNVGQQYRSGNKLPRKRSNSSSSPEKRNEKGNGDVQDGRLLKRHCSGGLSIMGISGTASSGSSGGIRQQAAPTEHKTEDREAQLDRIILEATDQMPGASGLGPVSQTNLSSTLVQLQTDFEEQRRTHAFDFERQTAHLGEVSSRLGSSINRISEMEAGFHTKIQELQSQAQDLQSQVHNVKTMELDSRIDANFNCIREAEKGLECQIQALQQRIQDLQHAKLDGISSRVETNANLINKVEKGLQDLQTQFRSLRNGGLVNSSHVNSTTSRLSQVENGLETQVQGLKDQIEGLTLHIRDCELFRGSVSERLKKVEEPPASASPKPSSPVLEVRLEDLGHRCAISEQHIWSYAERIKLLEEATRGLPKMHANAPWNAEPPHEDDQNEVNHKFMTLLEYHEEELDDTERQLGRLRDKYFATTKATGKQIDNLHGKLSTDADDLQSQMANLRGEHSATVENFKAQMKDMQEKQSATAQDMANQAAIMQKKQSTDFEDVRSQTLSIREEQAKHIATLEGFKTQLADMRDKHDEQATRVTELETQIGAVQDKHTVTIESLKSQVANISAKQSADHSTELEATKETASLPDQLIARMSANEELLQKQAERLQQQENTIHEIQTKHAAEVQGLRHDLTSFSKVMANFSRKSSLEERITSAIQAAHEYQAQESFETEAQMKAACLAIIELEAAMKSLKESKLPPTATI